MRLGLPPLLLLLLLCCWAADAVQGASSVGSPAAPTAGTKPPHQQCVINVRRIMKAARRYYKAHYETKLLLLKLRLHRQQLQERRLRHQNFLQRMRLRQKARIHRRIRRFRRRVRKVRRAYRVRLRSVTRRYQRRVMRQLKEKPLSNRRIRLIQSVFFRNGITSRRAALLAQKPIRRSSFGRSSHCQCKTRGRQNHSAAYERQSRRTGAIEMKLRRIAQLLGSGSSERGRRAAGHGSAGHHKVTHRSSQGHQPGQLRQSSDTPLFRRLGQKRRLVLYNKHPIVIPSRKQAARALKRISSLQRRTIEAIESILRTRNSIARVRMRLDRLVHHRRVLNEGKIMLNAKVNQQVRLRNRSTNGGSEGTRREKKKQEKPKRMGERKTERKSARNKKQQLRKARKGEKTVQRKGEESKKKLVKRERKGKKKEQKKEGRKGLKKKQEKKRGRKGQKKAQKKKGRRKGQEKEKKGGRKGQKKEQKKGGRKGHEKEKKGGRKGQKKEQKKGGRKRQKKEQMKRGMKGEGSDKGKLGRKGGNKKRQNNREKSKGKEQRKRKAKREHKKQNRRGTSHRKPVLSRRVAHLRKKHSALAQHIKRISMKQRRLLGRMAVLRKRVRRQDARFQSLMLRMTRQLPRWNLVDKRMLHSVVGETVRVIRTAHRPTSKHAAGSTAPVIISASRMKKLLRMVGNPQRRVTRTIGERLNNIRRHVHNEERSIALKRQAARLQSRRHQFADRIIGLKSRLSRLKTRLGLLKRRQDRLQHKPASKSSASSVHLRRMAKRVNSAVLSVSNRIHACSRQVKQLRQRIALKQQRIKEISLKRRQIQRRVANLQQRIEEQDKRIASNIHTWARRLIRYGMISEYTMFLTLSNGGQMIKRVDRRVKARIGQRLRAVGNQMQAKGASSRTVKPSSRHESISRRRAARAERDSIRKKIRRLKRRVEINRHRIVRTERRQKLLRSKLGKWRAKVTAIGRQISTSQAGREHLTKHRRVVKNTVPGASKVKPDSKHKKLLSSSNIAASVTNTMGSLRQKQERLRKRVARMSQRLRRLRRRLLTVRRRIRRQMKRMQRLAKKKRVLGRRAVGSTFSGRRDIRHKEEKHQPTRTHSEGRRAHRRVARGPENVGRRERRQPVVKTKRIFISGKKVLLPHRVTPKRRHVRGVRRQVAKLRHTRRRLHSQRLEVLLRLSARAIIRKLVSRRPDTVAGTAAKKKILGGKKKLPKVTKVEVAAKNALKSRKLVPVRALRAIQSNLRGELKLLGKKLDKSTSDFKRLVHQTRAMYLTYNVEMRSKFDQSVSEAKNAFRRLISGHDSLYNSAYRSLVSEESGTKTAKQGHFGTRK